MNLSLNHPNLPNTGQVGAGGSGINNRRDNSLVAVKKSHSVARQSQQTHDDRLNLSIDALNNNGMIVFTDLYYSFQVVTLTLTA